MSNAQELFSYAGVAIGLILSLAFLVFSCSRLYEAIMWNYYRGIRGEIRDVLKWLAENMGYKERLDLPVVQFILSRLHDRELFPGRSIRDFQNRFDQQREEEAQNTAHPDSSPVMVAAQEPNHG